MCNHDFVTIKAGALFCEDCGLFLPAYPEQMAKDSQEALAKAVDATVQDIMKEYFVEPLAKQLNQPAFSQFAKFAKPLIRATFPAEVAAKVVDIVVSGGR